MTTDSHGPIDAGGVRPVVARWIVTADLELKTAAHLGGSGYGPVDMVVIRDSLDRSPLLPGTSLAGALRGHLSDVLSGYYSEEHADIANLFGAPRISDEGGQSPLIVFDSLGEFPTGIPIEIRDGVAIDPKTGTAGSHLKYDIEVLPAGTVFPIRLELLIDCSLKESRLLNLFATALEGLSRGGISLGARRSRGFGAVEAINWRALRFDLTTREGWLDWLTSDALKPHDDATVAPAKDPWSACQAAYANITREIVHDLRKRVIVEAALDFQGGLLIRSPSETSDSPDAVHLKSGKKTILSGTSLTGVLRQRAARITRLVRSDKSDIHHWIEHIFGSNLDVNKSSDRNLHASRLRISESVINNGTSMRPARIGIDRFTQGVVSGALFEEEPYYCGSATVRLELRNPKDGETGLLLLLLKDLLSGDLPVGGSSSIGRGYVRGTAIVKFENGETMEIGPNLQVSSETEQAFAKLISAFANRPPQEKRGGTE